MYLENSPIEEIQEHQDRYRAFTLDQHTSLNASPTPTAPAPRHNLQRVSKQPTEGQGLAMRQKHDMLEVTTYTPGQARLITTAKIL